MELDASNYGTSAIVTQRISENGRILLWPIVFLFKQISPAKYNYGIGDKVLLAIVKAFELCHYYAHWIHVTVLTNKNNLQ